MLASIPHINQLSSPHRNVRNGHTNHTRGEKRRETHPGGAESLHIDLHGGTGTYGPLPNIVPVDLLHVITAGPGESMKCGWHI